MGQATILDDSVGDWELEKHLMRKATWYVELGRGSPAPEGADVGFWKGLILFFFFFLTVMKTTQQRYPWQSIEWETNSESRGTVGQCDYLHVIGYVMLCQ